MQRTCVYAVLLGSLCALFATHAVARVRAGGCQVSPVVQAFGQGSSGTNGVPALAPSGLPAESASFFGLRISGGAPGSAARIYMSVSQSELFVPELGATFYPGLGGLHFYCPTPLDTAGNGSIDLSPILDLVCGQTLVAQGVIPDEGATGGIALTQAVFIQFGDALLAPTVNPPPPATKETAISLSGKGSVVGAKIRVEGGASVVEVDVAQNLTFSATVPLNLNAKNTLYVTQVVGTVISPSAVTQTLQDQQPPTLFIDFPADGTVLSQGTTTVAGRVADTLSGFMDLTVKVNGVRASVNIGIGTNGTFEAQGVALDLGVPTLIEATGVDALGNVTVEQTTLTYQPPTGFAMEKVPGGDNQTGVVEDALPTPIGVRVTKPDGVTPLPGKIVTFKVVKSNGLLASSAGGAKAAVLQAFTDGGGNAFAYWTLGTDAGCGNNRVQVTSTDIAGSIFFCASSNPGVPVQVNVGGGASQVAPALGVAAEPLAAWVNDGTNGIEGVSVTFKVLSGPGVVRGPIGPPKPELIVKTTATGHASVEFSQVGEGNNIVEATFPGNAGQPARFTVFGVNTAQASTSLVGVVFDNSQQPIEHAECRLTVGSGAPLTVHTDDQGQFVFNSVPNSGAAELRVDGGTATKVGGVAINSALLHFPELHFTPFITPNATNELPRPVLLPRLDPINDVVFDGTQDAVLTLRAQTPAGIVNVVDGLQMVIKAGTHVVLADGSVVSPANPKKFSLNQVHADDIPMPIPDGAAAPFAWTLQPAGAHFDPPVQVVYPNMSGLAPGSVTYFLSFDHAVGEFEIVASGHVVEDGSRSMSDPGSGITVSGWGCQCPPYPPVGDCEKCIVGCADKGVLSGGSVVPDKVFVCIEEGVEFTIDGVADSGGKTQTLCPDGTVEITNISAGALIYEWTVTKNGKLFSTGTGPKTAGFTPTEAGTYGATFLVSSDRDCPPKPIVIEGSVIVGAVHFDPSKVRVKNQPTITAFDKSIAICETDNAIDLADYLLPSPVLPPPDDLLWVINGVEGTGKGAGIIDLTGISLDDMEIQVFEVTVRISGCQDADAGDGVIVVVYADETLEEYTTWHGTAATDTAWLAGLPQMFSKLDNGNADPEPSCLLFGCCDPQLWESPTTLGNLYHPGATYEMRSETPAGLPGHQTTYDGSGKLITTDLAAGSACRAAPASLTDPFSLAHISEDVWPYIRAAQLDGNPVEASPSIFVPATLTKPLMYRGAKLDQYLVVRPAVPNAKPLLSPGDCGQ